MNQTTICNGHMSRIHESEAAPERLSAVDLNLTVAFDALARELSVTRAAQRVGVTQSAMSHSLRRLRELLGDPLLVRGRGGMVLTPRAEALVVPLRSALVMLGRALAAGPGFEPGSARRAFSIASPDLFDVLMVPALLERVRDRAPAVDIAVVPAEERRLAERLETGEVDVAITPRLDELDRELAPGSAGGLLQRTLLRDRFVCLLRADHPALRARRGLTLEGYAALSHALVSPRGEGPGFVDRALERHGLVRRIALRVPHFYSALAIVAHSDLVLTAPSALGRLAPAGLPVRALAPPLRLPRHSVNLVWHERFSNDPGHRWLRDLVLEVARATYREA
jgi:DNA-binding transcriptional LysR family regulator